ncbi:coiled-coil domain-containing protein 158-like [Paramacrobiotus metropolitanus]|uniref:coiled-coil domain-containing protein 158-like n=1 Tax=Paramacrobiotus metropolitanus TaxID=2943436 RepID=UPI002446126A|nr:coiled-coil domain-containing protein 158-like [Paramacrobiotus metropolitanus]
MPMSPKASDKNIMHSPIIPGLDLAEGLPNRLQSSALKSSFQLDYANSEYPVERRNIKRLLREYDHLKQHVRELDDKVKLLQKDKTFLIGRNTFLESANKELSGKLSAAENQIVVLNRDRETLFRNAEIIHEKDRKHYLHSFQKVLKDVDSEKMKDLNKAVRKQIQNYESQIHDLRASLTEVSTERSALKSELDKASERLGTLQLEKVTSQSEISQHYLETRLRLAAKAQECDELQQKYTKIENDLIRVEQERRYVTEKYQLFSNESEKNKNGFETEIRRLTTMLREKDVRLDAMTRNAMQERAELSFKTDRELANKQKTIDNLSRTLSDLRAALQEKTSSLLDVDKKVEDKVSQQVSELSRVVRDQNYELAQSAATIQSLKEQLRTEQEVLKRVRRTRDELFVILQNDPDAKEILAAEVLEDGLVIVDSKSEMQLNST